MVGPLCVWSLPAAVCLFGAETLRPAFYEEAAHSRPHDHPRMIAGLVKAESFRRKVLAHHVGPIGAAVEAFRRGAMTPASRPDLSGFTVTAESLATQLRGAQRLDAQQSFAPFAGRWYGDWDGKEVNHHWSAISTPAALQPVAGALGLARSVPTQYAWVSDGFGWNLLVQPDGTAGHTVLGYVYQFTERDTPPAGFEFPLVAYADGPGRLVWIAPSAVFFEEVHGAAGDPDQTYSITGFWTDHAHAEPPTRGFQAVYTRDPAHRPAWGAFDVLAGPIAATPPDRRSYGPAPRAARSAPR